MSLTRTMILAGKSLLLCCLLATSSQAMAASDEATRDKVRTQSAQVLQRLYVAQPAAREVIAAAKGYATFSRWGLTLGAIGGAAGRGLLVAQPSGEETFMRFVEGSAGLGFGIKKYDLIFVFLDQGAMNGFMTQGWQAGGQATAAAKAGAAGGKTMEGAFSVSPGIVVYQVTDKGLAAELGIKGTKYYKDTSLNQ